MKRNRPKFRNSPGAAVILHLLIPGLGHVLWREYLFGLFVFLVTLMAGALFVVSLFISIPLAAKIIIYGFPAAFYVVSFVDLIRSIKRHKGPPGHSTAKVWTLFILGGLFQILWPVAPTHFAWHNAPDFFVMESNNLSPIYAEGDLLKASSLAYMLKSFMVEKPILHSIPQRFEIIRFSTGGQEQCGIVLGFPGEDVEVVDGVVVVNDMPLLDQSRTAQLLGGDWPLTRTPSYSLLVASPRLGRIERVYEVTFTDIIGKVERIL